MLFQLGYLHLTLAHSKVLGCRHFECEYLVHLFVNFVYHPWPCSVDVIKLKHFHKTCVVFSAKEM